MHQYNKPADRLLEAIRQHYLRVHGVDADKKTLQKEAVKVIKERLA